MLRRYGRKPFGIRWYGVVALLVLTSSILTPSAAQAPTDEITRAEEMWASAWTNGDKAAYTDLLSDEFTWTYITGRVIDKNQAVDALNPFTIPEDSKTIRVYGDTAVVFGTASLVFEGRPITERFVRMWVRNETGRWQAVLFQATEIE